MYPFLDPSSIYITWGGPSGFLRRGGRDAPVAHLPRPPELARSQIKWSRTAQGSPATRKRIRLRRAAAAPMAKCRYRTPLAHLASVVSVRLVNAFGPSGSARRRGTTARAHRVGPLTTVSACPPYRSAQRRV